MISRAHDRKLRYRSLKDGEIQYNELRRFATQSILLHNKNYLLAIKRNRKKTVSFSNHKLNCFVNKVINGTRE